MATSNKDNIEDLIIGINEDIFSGDQAFMKDLDNCVAEMEEVNVYSCVACEKTYKSKGGLTRHKKSRHPDVSVESSHQTSLDINTLTQLLVNSTKTMGNDECLPDSVVEELTNYSISSEDMNHSYGYLQDIIAEIIRKGNVEKFFPMFYNCVQETGGLFPCQEMLLYFLGLTLHGYFHMDFNQKERDIICYLSGYVFETLNRRIRNSKHWNSQINEENLKVLLSGKTENSHNDLTLVNVKDRGGL